jgi:uncharacterized protein with PQ loop repeat
MTSIAFFFGLFGSIILPMIPIPQIMLIHKTKAVKDMSIAYVCLQILANTTFFIYGTLQIDYFIMIPNLALILENIYIIFLIKFMNQVEYRNIALTELDSGL